MILLQAYGGQEIKCGNLNVIGPHNHIGSVTIRRCGFFGVGMPCWKTYATVGSGFEVSWA